MNSDRENYLNLISHFIKAFEYLAVITTYMALRYSVFKKREPSKYTPMLWNLEVTGFSSSFSHFINSFLPAKSFDSSVGKCSVSRLFWHSFHLLVWQSSNICHFCILGVIKLYEIPLDCFSSFRRTFLKIHFLCWCTIN